MLACVWGMAVLTSRVVEVVKSVPLRFWWATQWVLDAWVTWS